MAHLALGEMVPRSRIELLSTDPQTVVLTDELSRAISEGIFYRICFESHLPRLLLSFLGGRRQTKVPSSPKPEASILKPIPNVSTLKSWFRSFFPLCFCSN